MGLLGTIILLIFIFLWCNPVLKRHREMSGYIDRKTELKALLFGLFPATVVLLLCQFALGWLFKLARIDNNGILICFMRAFIMYGIVEEAVKYGFACLVVRRFERLKKIDIMLIFGFVGMGYEIAETLMIGNLIAGIGRGIFVAHIMYQFIMGHFFYESIHAKDMGDEAMSGKNMILSLAIPMLIHGINDLFCEISGIYIDKVSKSGWADAPKSLAAFILVCIAMIIFTNVFCLIWGLKLTQKDPDVEIQFPLPERRHKT